VSPPDRRGRKQPARPAAQGGNPPEGGWESLKVDELKQELEARGLTKSGTKAELIARLEEDDAAAEAPAEEPTADEVEDYEVEDFEVEEPQAAEEAEEAAEAEEAEEEAASAPETRRRGSAETTTGERRAAPRREADGDLVVRARSKYVRSAPRKARLVMDHIRGKEVEQARAILTHAPRTVAEDILKLLNSAVANAESNYELGPDELRVRKAFVDEGPTIKRFRPRALGRATRINKRTSHMTIELTTTGNER
jgi:ribosomal protein L22